MRPAMITRSNYPSSPVETTGPADTARLLDAARAADTGSQAGMAGQADTRRPSTGNLASNDQSANSLSSDNLCNDRQAANRQAVDRQVADSLAATTGQADTASQTGASSQMAQANRLEHVKKARSAYQAAVLRQTASASQTIPARQAAPANRAASLSPATLAPQAAPAAQAAASAKRTRCPVCLRAAASCICHWIAPLSHAVDVLILQHPLEVHNAKGSARLLHLSLPNSRMLTGEHFPPDPLAALLAGKHNVLLYPDTPGDRSLGIAPPPALDPAMLLDPAQLRLVVLDGTWRKSRKMLYLNPQLQQLPRLPLRDTPASHYLIRKAHAPDQLSTLEATCYALMQLEHDVPRFVPLIAAFDGFVAQQLSYVMPHAEKV